MNIIIVENEPLVAMDLQRILEKNDHKILGVFHKGQDALDFIANNQPEFVILDIHLDGHLDGIEVASVLLEKYQIPYAFLTSFSDKNTLDRAKLTLPVGYIVKPFVDHDVITTIEVGAHRFKEARRHGLKEIDLFNQNLSIPVTEREYEIICGLIDGLTNSQLATRQFVSENTIKTHIKRIFQKFEVHSRAELTKKVMSV